MSVKLDIAIIGAGAAGLVLSSALAQTDKIFHIFEKNNKHSILANPKSYAFNYKTIQNLNAIFRLKLNYTPIKKVIIRYPNNIFGTHIDSKNLHLSKLGGAVLHKDVSDSCLAIIDPNCISWQSNIENLNYDQDCKEYSFYNNNTKYTTKFLVVANGKCDPSWQKILNFTYQEKDKKNIHLAQITHTRSNNYTAWQFFQNNKILGIVPLLNKYSAQVVMTSCDSNMSNYQSIQDIEKIIGNRLGKIVVNKNQQQKISLYSADTSSLKSAVLLGTAAYSIAPIAAQGLNQIIKDISILFKNIQQSSNHDNWLNTFNQQRKTRYDKLQKSIQRSTSSIKYTQYIAPLIPNFESLLFELLT